MSDYNMHRGWYFQTLLKNVLGGKALLAAYKNMGELDSTLKKTLVHIIIQNEVDKLLLEAEDDTISEFS